MIFLLCNITLFFRSYCLAAWSAGIVSRRNGYVFRNTWLYRMCKDVNLFVMWWKLLML